MEWAKDTSIRNLITYHIKRSAFFENLMFQDLTYMDGRIATVH